MADRKEIRYMLSIPLKLLSLILDTLPVLREKPYEIKNGQINKANSIFKKKENVLLKILLIIPLKASSEDIRSGTTTKRTGIAQIRPTTALPISFFFSLFPAKSDFTVSPVFIIVETAERKTPNVWRLPFAVPIAKPSKQTMDNKKLTRKPKNLTLPFVVHINIAPFAKAKSPLINGKNLGSRYDCYI